MLGRGSPRGSTGFLSFGKTLRYHCLIVGTSLRQPNLRKSSGRSRHRGSAPARYPQMWRAYTTPMTKPKPQRRIPSLILVFVCEREIDARRFLRTVPVEHAIPREPVKAIHSKKCVDCLRKHKRSRYPKTGALRPTPPMAPCDEYCGHSADGYLKISMEDKSDALSKTISFSRHTSDLEC